MDLIVDSFKHLPNHRLVVIGDGPDYEKVKAKAGSNVSIMGYQPNEVLIDYLQRAKALIFVAEEDLGLIPLEAQACGTPVIAYGKGGALETVRGLDDEKPTGVLFAEQNVQSICTAIHTFEAHQHAFTVANCTANAYLFDAERFKEKMKAFVLANAGLG